MQVRIWASYRTADGGDDEMRADLVGQLHIYTENVDRTTYPVTNWEDSLTRTCHSRAAGGCGWEQPRRRGLGQQPAPAQGLHPCPARGSLPACLPACPPHPPHWSVPLQ